MNWTKTIDYTGHIIYENGSLKRKLIDGGYIESGVYYFYQTDHLGNNRVVMAQRVASGSNPRQSRVANAKTVTTKANNYEVTKAYAAGTTGGNATSKAVEAVTSLKKPEEKK